MALASNLPSSSQILKLRKGGHLSDARSCTRRLRPTARIVIFFLVDAVHFVGNGGICEQGDTTTDLRCFGIPVYLVLSWLGDLFF